MSEFLTKADSSQEGLKRLIKDLHAGLPLEKARDRFARLMKGVDAAGIAAMEQSLIDEGFPVEEITRLCDVHAAVFEKALLRPALPWGGGRAARLARMSGHPVHSFKAENRAALAILKRLAGALRADAPADELVAVTRELSAYELHLRRKENQLFPLLEARGFSGPSKVMWAKDDELRSLLKACLQALESGSSDAKAYAAKTFPVLSAALKGMIFKEEKILFPAALRKLGEADWARVRRGEEEIGYAWIRPGAEYDPMLALRAAGSAGAIPTGRALAPAQDHGSEGTAAGTVPLSVGALSPEQIDLMLKALPMDVTFVDEHDKVLYYTGSQHRVFPRSPAIIGRDVRNCHPAKSVHVVERIVEAFKRKERDSAEFWIELGGRFVHIRYFPVYDQDGTYRGTIEASQDCTEIRALQGERRLLDWE
jgi:DUF438 domain-containing protein